MTVALSPSIRLRTPSRGVVLVIHAPQPDTRFWWFALMRDARKFADPYLLQMVSDLDHPPKVETKSDGTCALRVLHRVWLNLASDAEADRARAFIAEFDPVLRKEPA
jgi:hypothetical protein